MILGVCDWLSRRLDINVDYLRVGFVLLTILGGSGILLYLIFFLIKAIKNE